MSRAIILLQFQYCTYLVCVVIYVLLLSYDYFDETLRRNVPKYHCLYIYIYIFFLNKYIYIYVCINTHVFRWCGVISH